MSDFNAVTVCFNSSNSKLTSMRAAIETRSLLLKEEKFFANGIRIGFAN